MRPQAFRFSHPLRVRWSEVDMQAVVFNGHYLTYFDVAFTEYWRATGLAGPLAQAATGFELFARKASLEYHASARFDDLLDIYVRCARLGRSSLQILLEIHRHEDDPEAPLSPLISGELVYVYVQVASKSSVPVPEEWRAALLRFETTPPLT